MSCVWYSNETWINNTVNELTKQILAAIIQFNKEIRNDSILQFNLPLLGVYKIIDIYSFLEVNLSTK